jgi:leukotriene-A4 hydrolase
VDGKDAKWSLADRVEPYGSALTVELENAVAKDGEVDVDVGLIRK